MSFRTLNVLSPPHRCNPPPRRRQRQYHSLPFVVLVSTKQVMESLGVLRELREAGALDGDRVMVGESEIVIAEPPENLG